MNMKLECLLFELMNDELVVWKLDKSWIMVETWMIFEYQLQLKFLWWWICLIQVTFENNFESRWTLYKLNDDEWIKLEWISKQSLEWIQIQNLSSNLSPKFLALERQVLEETRTPWLQWTYNIISCARIRRSSI